MLAGDLVTDVTRLAGCTRPRASPEALSDLSGVFRLEGRAVVLLAQRHNIWVV